MLSDQKQRLLKANTEFVLKMLLPSNCDGPGGGQCFVLLVTLITPWWIQLSLFLLLCPFLSASCSFLSTNYCVYAYLRHAVQEYRLSGGNYAKTDKCPVKQVKLLTTKYVILIPTTCEMKTCVYSSNLNPQSSYLTKKRSKIHFLMHFGCLTLYA